MLSCLLQKLKKVTDEATKYKQLYLKNTGKENVPCWRRHIWSTLLFIINLIMLGQRCLQPDRYILFLFLVNEMIVYIMCESVVWWRVLSGCLIVILWVVTVLVVVCLPCLHLPSRHYRVHPTCPHALVLYISLCQSTFHHLLHCSLCHRSIFYFVFVLSSFHILLHFSFCHRSIFYFIFVSSSYHLLHHFSLHHHNILNFTFLLSSFHLLRHFSRHHFSRYFAILCHNFIMLITSPQDSHF